MNVLVQPKLCSYLCQSLPRPPCVLRPASAAAQVQPAVTGSAPRTMQHLQDPQTAWLRPCTHTRGTQYTGGCRSSAGKLPASFGVCCCHTKRRSTYRHTVLCCLACPSGRSVRCPYRQLHMANTPARAATQVSYASCQSTPTKLSAQQRLVCCIGSHAVPQACGPGISAIANSVRAIHRSAPSCTPLPRWMYHVLQLPRLLTCQQLPVPQL
jgi:hypothetical protein